MANVNELIDRIDEITMESELSVLNSLSRVYAKQADMISRCEDLESLEACFAEADTPVGTAPAAKPSLIRRMFAAIKKFFALIGRCFKVIIQTLGNIFRKPGEKKSMSQILDECGLKPTGNEVQAQRGAAWGDYLIEFRNNDRFIIKYQSYLREKNSANVASKGNVPVYQGAARNSSRAINLLVNESYRNSMFAFINAFITFLKNTISSGSFDEKAWNDIMRHDYEGLRENKGWDEYEVSYKQLVDVQSRINNLQKEFDTINYEQYDAMLSKLPGDQRSKFEAAVGKRIGQLTEDLNEMQMSFNQVANDIAHAFDLPPQYHGTINSPEALEEFVQKCVEGGIPPRFVIHGIVMICTPELKGSKNPAGQSRVVLFPTNDQSIVYKVAYNGFGISSNKAEIAVSNFIKSHHSQDKLVAPITNVYGAGYVIAMERAGGKRPSDSDVLRLRRKFATFSQSAHWNMNVGDLHHDNVRQLPDGEWVAIDYGWAPRG